MGGPGQSPSLCAPTLAPPHLPPAAVRGAGPAAKLLLFIHRLCLLKPCPFFPALPAPLPTPALASVVGPPVPHGLRGRLPDRLWVTGLETASTACRGTGYTATFPPTGLRVVASFSVWKGPGTPSQSSPGQGVVWQGTWWRAGVQCAGWWVGRLLCVDGVMGGSRSHTFGERGLQRSPALAMVVAVGFGHLTSNGCVKPLSRLISPSLAPGWGTIPLQPRHPSPREENLLTRNSSTGLVHRSRVGAPRMQGEHLGGKALSIRPHDKSRGFDLN